MEHPTNGPIPHRHSIRDRVERWDLRTRRVSRNPGPTGRTASTVRPPRPKRMPRQFPSMEQVGVERSSEATAAASWKMAEDAFHDVRVAAVELAWAEAGVRAGIFGGVGLGFEPDSGLVGFVRLVEFGPELSGPVFEDV